MEYAASPHASLLLLLLRLPAAFFCSATEERGGGGAWGGGGWDVSLWSQMEDFMHYGQSVIGEASYVRKPRLYN